MSRRRRVVIILAGIAAGLYAAVASFASPYDLSRRWILLNVPIIDGVGWSFIFVGMLASARRPRNQVGVLMIVVGFTWFAYPIGLVRRPVPYAFGLFTVAFYQVVLGHLFVVFPHGRAVSALERRTIVALYTWFVVDAALTTVTTAPSCAHCPVNPTLIPFLASMRTPLWIATDVVTVLLAIVVVAIVVRHWRSASPPARRALAPAFWALGPTLIVILAFQLPLYGGTSSELPFYGIYARGVQEWLNPIEWVVLALVPIGFLVGVLRTRLGRAAVGDMVVELVSSPSGEGVQGALAKALGDPSLELLLALPGGGFVDSSGRARDLPLPSAQRVVTEIAGLEERIAAIVHDPALNDDPGFVAAAGAAARLAIENARLQADIKAQLEEVRASRMRIVQAGDAERRRVERNLHDGAQQRLMSVSLALGIARRQAQSRDDAQLLAVIDEASAELGGALRELRELARGVHPAVLSRSGLRPALRSLAERCSVPVVIDAVPTQRLAEDVEGTAYFVVCEALANMAKHSKASQGRVSVTLVDGRLRVEVIDDGVGGADCEAGSGLSGLSDRLAALGGWLEVFSPPGSGTRILAELPCALR